MSETTQPKQHTYTFAGIRWIPDYKDFDHDEHEIKAESPEEAYKILNKQFKNWQSVQITHVNGIETTVK